MKHFTSLLISSSIVICASCFIAGNAFATLTTWDPQGTTGGTITSPTSGGYTGNMSQTWENAMWSTSETGQATPQNWVESTAALFACQANGNTPAFTVTMNNNHTVAGIFDGPEVPDPCTVTIVGTGSIVLPSASPGNGFAVSSDAGDPGVLTINNVISGTGNMIPQDDGQIYLNGTNTFTGGILLGYSGNSYDGVLYFNNKGSFGTGAITVSNTGGALCAIVAESDGLTITNSFKWTETTGGVNFVGSTPTGATFSGPWTLTSTATVGSGVSGNIVIASGVLSGAGGLNKFNPGILRLSGANTYTGNTVISNGVLQLGANGGVPGKSSVTVTNSSTTSVLDVNGFSGAIDGLIGNGTVDNTSSNNGTLSIGNNNGSSTYNGTIQNSGTGTLGITKAGTGAFTLTPASTTYSGSTILNGGTFVLGAANAIPGGSPVVVNTGTVLNMASNSDTIGALSGGGLVTNDAGGLTLGGNTYPSNFAGYSCFFGTIDQGNVSKTGNGVMSLRQTNMWNTNVNFSFQGGVLSVGAGPNRLPTNFTLSVPSGGLFQLDANVQTVSSLNGATGAINLGGGSLVVNATSGSFYSGTIQNSELITNSTAAGHGLRGYYYSNIDMSGLATVRDDAVINFANLTLPADLPSPPYPKTNYISIRWLGQIQTTVAGTYSFITTSDDGQRLWVAGTNLIDDWVSEGATAKTNSITLAANTRYDIVFEYMNIAGGASTKLAWIPPGDSNASVIPTDYLYLPPAGNLVIGGTSQVTLAGSNNYTGGTIVANGGTLDASGDYTLGSGNVYVTNNGSLTMDSGTVNSYVGSNGDLVISPSSILNLNYTGTDTIHGFSTNGGATYLPTGTYGASGAGATYTISQAIGTGILNVTATATTNTLTGSGSPSVYGSSVNFTSTVTGSAPTPTGTVTFYDGASAIGMATLAGGQAVLTVSDLQAITSPHSITAVYNGDATHIQSTSSPLVQTVDPLAVSATNLVVANKLYDTTTSATFVSGSLAGVLSNDSNYVFLSSATATFASKAAGTNVTVNVTGFVLGGNLAGDYTVSPASTTTTATITNATLTVTNLTAINRVYTGSTNVSLNTASAALVGVLGSDNVTLNTAGAVGSVASAGVGTNKTVTVSGLTTGGADAGNYKLTEPSTTVTISQASTTNIVGSTANPSTPGASVSFSSTPTPVAPGAGTPTGSVIFLTNSVPFSTNTLSAGTTTSLSTTNLPVGTNIITAEYAGDANFIGSTNTLAQVVGANSAPGALSISRAGGNVILNWSGSFTLQAAPAVNGTNSGFTDVPGPVTTGPYTNTNSAAEQFFRLRN